MWLSVDPLAEEMPEWSSYAYAFNNPVMYTDPTGMAPEIFEDPIYGKNFWGNVKLIGDDGKNDGKAYLVQGSDKRAVKTATKNGEDYIGSLTESDNVMNVPTGGVMDDVIDSVTDTSASQKENGGHSNIGDANATRWDEGPAAVAFTDKDGNKGAKATINPFKIGGKSEVPTDASNVEFWWHTHPKTTVNGISLGSSTPSVADKTFQGKMQSRGFKGNTFVIGVRSSKVTFYNKDKPLMTIKYSDFKKIGGKN
jgi:small nuclear ribonucleoprotein (snRNP)-like protein